MMILMISKNPGFQKVSNFKMAFMISDLSSSIPEQRAGDLLNFGPKAEYSNLIRLRPPEPLLCKA